MDNTLTHLDEQRVVWERKPLIRELYGHYHELLLQHCCTGDVVEIGAGCGNLKASHPHVRSIDIVNSEWVDIVANAEQLPFSANSVDNLVMLDVLHHVRHPMRFFKDAARVLRSGGRIVLLEPGISPLSHFFYHALHPEPVNMHADLFTDSAQSGDYPFDSNQAIPTLLFEKHAQRFLRECPEYKLTHTAWLGAVSYPLSGGFRSWQLLGSRSMRWCLALERNAPTWLCALLSFRLLTVLERQP